MKENDSFLARFMQSNDIAYDETDTDTPEPRKQRIHKGKSIIKFPRDYVVIDTETTGLDYEYCNLIEVCAIRYVDGEFRSIFTSLIQPPPAEVYDPHTDSWYEEYVDAYITGLTGITNDMLEAAPKEDQVIPDFLKFVGDSVLIGHNVNFDINFLYDAAERCGGALSNDYVDTMRIARKCLPDLKHHRLKDVAEALKVEFASAHRADIDCMTTAQCYECLRSNALEKYSEEDFEKLFARNYGKRAEMLSNITATVRDIDDTNPIYGKIVVFTGVLSAMERKDAFQIVANLGGIPKDSITTKTNYLVIGSSDFAKSVKDGKTNKMKQAESYKQKGHEILVLSENAFFDLIADYT